MDILAAPTDQLSATAAPSAGPSAGPVPDAAPALRPAADGAADRAADGAADRAEDGAADGAEPPVLVRPAAVVVVAMPSGGPRALRPVLASLAGSRAAGGLPAAPGALALLVLVPGADAAVVDESVPADFPFPLRVEAWDGDVLRQARRAAAWAAALGVPEVPVLLVPDGRPVAPRWAYDLLAALRDGADLVPGPAGPLVRRLPGVLAGLLPAAPPVAVSARALWAMDRWSAAGGARAGGASPWRRPARAGLGRIPA